MSAVIEQSPTVADKLLGRSATADGEAPPPEYWAAADEVWAEYQRTHDVSHLDGQAVGIDPVGREVFFGRDADEVCERLIAAGRFRPLRFTRVGRRAYAIARPGRKW